MRDGRQPPVMWVASPPVPLWVIAFGMVRVHFRPIPEGFPGVFHYGFCAFSAKTRLSLGLGEQDSHASVSNQAGKEAVIPGFLPNATRNNGGMHPGRGREADDVLP